MAAERLSELEARIVELETAHYGKAAELEERVEFAERLLAQASGERRAIGPEGVAGAAPDREHRGP
jgi:hypothetical protein